MSKKLYVGNLPYQLTDEEFREAFEPFGPLESATLVRDGYTQQLRGFGFVEVADDKAEAAIAALNGKPFKGRPMVVNEARPREERGGGERRGGGGGERRSGGGGDRSERL